MKKLLLTMGLLASPLVYSQTYNHNVNIYKAGVDPNIILEGSKQAQEIQKRNNQTFTELGKSLAEAKNRKKMQERKVQYTKELIQSTDGLKNVSSDSILPLVEKYPEFSDDLLNILQNKND